MEGFHRGLKINYYEYYRKSQLAIYRENLIRKLPHRGHDEASKTIYEYS